MKPGVGAGVGGKGLGTMSWRRPFVASVAAPFVVVAVGCGGDAAPASEPEAQPAPGMSVFTEGNFDELPRPGGAHAIGERETVDDTISRQFTVDGMLPGEIIDFFDERLDGWTEIDRTTVAGGDTASASWRDGGQLLEVTATREDVAERGSTQDLEIQYGVVLRPAP